MSNREVMQQALEFLESGNFVYPTKLAVDLRTALEQQQAEPVAWTTMPEAEDWCFVSGSKDPTGKLEGKWFPLYTTPPQRQWQGLTDEEILRTDPWEILRADPWMGTSDSNINPYQILLKVRTLEAKLKERNT